MDLTVSKTDLTRALYLTESIVAKKTTMPILSNILLSVSEGKLRLSATDLEITAVASAKADIRSNGSTTVNARVFCDIVRELPDGPVEIRQIDSERLEIVAKKSKFKMVGVSAEEFPSLPGVGFEPKSKISSKQLLEMVNKTIYAVSLDETRFNLNGVCFDLVTQGKGKKEEKVLRLVATDGHRLAMVTRPAGTLAFNDRVIVPRKGLAEIRRFIESDEDREVAFDIQEGFFVLEIDDAKISMRLIDGEFPDYAQVFPNQKGTIAKIPCGEFLQALRRTVLMVTDKNKCVKLDFGANTLRISSSSPELGEAVEEMGATYEGPQISIGFNARYLIDICSSIGETQNLQLELTGELGAGKFSPESDDSYVAVVMPMRL